MKSPITALKKIGCKVVSRETTAGAQKWWLTYPTKTLVDVAAQFDDPGVDSFGNRRRRVLVELGIDSIDFGEGSEYLGNGFSISFQTEGVDGFSGIFLAKHRNTKAGIAYRAGIDC